MAEEPDRVKRIFVNEDENQINGISINGIYAFNFWALMFPVTITIDDRLPMKIGKPGKVMYAKTGRDMSVWATLFEKALAKYHGTYEPLWAGNAQEALEVVAGSPGVRYDMEPLSVDELWNLWKQNDRRRAMINLGDPTSDSPYDIVANHAYSFIKCVEVAGERLVAIRNPWGRESYTGPWSREDTDRWTEANKKAAGYDELYENEGQDGVFFTTIEIAKSAWNMFFINYDAKDMYRDGWLKIQDDTVNPGDHKKCGEVCTKHEFTLTSTVRQRVFASTNVWWSRGYPDSCREGATKSGPNDNRKHVFMIEGFEKEMLFNQGSEMPAPFMMNAD